jgi:hypothetical protein
MVELIEFPQRQHQEFRKLVFKVVYEAAQLQELDVETYISFIYFSGENPPLFSSAKNLERIYCRFKDLVESSISSDPDADKLSDTDKTYLCFRIYLHSLCMSRKKLPESDSEQYLQDALKEYFQSAEKIFSSKEENKILRYINHLRRQAMKRPGTQPRV